MPITIKIGETINITRQPSDAGMGYGASGGGLKNYTNLPHRKLTPADIPNEPWSEAKNGDLVIYEDRSVGLEGSSNAWYMVEGGKLKQIWSGF